MQEYVESVVSAFSKFAKSLKFKVFFSFLLFVRKKVVSLQKETEKKRGDIDLRPYTIDEQNARIDRAESDFKAGLGIPSEEV